MQRFRAELHVHTVLSPCAAVEMIPPLIVQHALENDIRLIAITDHNQTANIQAVQKAAHESQLTVLPGIEIQTREEVHCLAIFETSAQAKAIQVFIDERLPDIPNRPDFFGEQFIVDETGEFIRHEARLLSNSIDASIEETARFVHSLGGLFIPAHVNRKAFGLLPTLGFVPKEMEVDALEISRHLSPEEAIHSFPQLKDYPLIQSGDVHLLSEFLGAFELIIDEPSIAEIRLALRQENNRKISFIPPEN